MASAVDSKQFEEINKHQRKMKAIAEFKEQSEIHEFKEFEEIDYEQKYEITFDSSYNKKGSFQNINDLCSIKSVSKKKKYPFHEKIESDIDPILATIFEQTFDIISKSLRKKNNIEIDQKLPPDLPSDDNKDDPQILPIHSLKPKTKPEPPTYVESEEDDDSKDDEKIISAQTLKSKSKPEPEPPTFVESEEEDDDDDDDKFDDTEMIVPFTISQIRNDVIKSFKKKIKNNSDENITNKFDDKLIDAVSNGFQSVYSRSPTVKEIGLILGAAVQKMKKIPIVKKRNDDLTIVQARFASISSQRDHLPVLLIKSAKKVVMENLKTLQKYNDDKKIGDVLKKKLNIKESSNGDEDCTSDMTNAQLLFAETASKGDDVIRILDAARNVVLENLNEIGNESNKRKITSVQLMMSKLTG